MSNVKVNKFQISPSRSCSVGIECGFFCHPQIQVGLFVTNIKYFHTTNVRSLQLHFGDLKRDKLHNIGTVFVINGQFRIIFFLAKSGSYRKPAMNILARVNIYLIFRRDGYSPVGNLTKTGFDIPQYTLCMLQGSFI